MQRFHEEGYFLARGAFDKQAIQQIGAELLRIGNQIDGETFCDLDVMLNHYKANDRKKSGSIYNGFKYLPAIKRLAVSERMNSLLRNTCGVRFPALIDINCRIDSAGEDKYLFNWHQDYWFSICSTEAVVAWIPVTGLEPSMGGLHIMSNRHTEGRILSTKAGTEYRSYADAVLLNEALPTGQAETINDMGIGDALLFKFNVLHRSVPVDSQSRSRFTVQLRFADYEDAQFIEANFRPGTVTSETVDYLTRK